MKKLVLFVAVVAAVSFASCSNKGKEAPVTPEAEVPAVVEDVVLEEALGDSIDLVEVVEELPAAE